MPRTNTNIGENVSKLATKTNVESSTEKNLGKAVGLGLLTAGVTYGVYKYVTGKSKSKSNSSSSSSSSGGGSSSSDSGSDGGGSSSGSGSGNTVTKKKTVVEEIPITNYNEALEFANREWNKIKRDNGRVLECQTLGSPQWKAGEWCSVYLPSFDIDDYMYITRVSQSSEGGDWTTNLSLVDYPPGWGKEELEENTDEENKEEEEDEDSEEDAS